MVDNICIIGCGNIGFKHLESILKFKKKLNIIIVEKNSDRQKKIINSLNNSFRYSHSIKFYKYIKFSLLNFKLLIVSTNSDTRKDILCNFFTKKNSAETILLEKILAPNLSNLNKIVEIINNRKIKSYVNCARRMYKSYQVLKKMIGKRKILQFNVKGSNWGLASNSIHMLDLFGYLYGNFSNVKSSHDLKKIYPSKRRRFYELRGKIKIIINNSSTITMEDLINKKNKFEIEIVGKNFKYTVKEFENKVIYNDKVKNLINKVHLFDVPFQSSLTSELLYKKIKLTSLYESYKYHKILIKLFDSYFKMFKKNNTNYLIT